MTDETEPLAIYPRCRKIEVRHSECDAFFARQARGEVVIFGLKVLPHGYEMDCREMCPDTTPQQPAAPPPNLKQALAQFRPTKAEQINLLPVPKTGGGSI